jgi:hypothetical protein
MDIKQLKDKVIEQGLISVATEKEEYAREGGKEGFEICRTLNTPEDFEKNLQERRQKELEMITSKENIDTYWRYRWATLQIEYVFEIMKVAWNQINLPLKYATLSGRAVIAYSKILSIENIEE